MSRMPSDPQQIDFILPNSMWAPHHSNFIGGLGRLSACSEQSFEACHMGVFIGIGVIEFGALQQFLVDDRGDSKGDMCFLNIKLGDQSQLSPPAVLNAYLGTSRLPP